MRKIWWIGSFEPGVSNVGDHAQTLAIQKYLQDYFPAIEVKQYYRNELSEFLNSDVAQDDLILINSSGDFGDRYPEWHIKRRAILQRFPNNQLIQLPTTVYYKNERMLEEDKEWWSKPNLTILCREVQSYNIAHSAFTCNVAFFPDFVFYLSPLQTALCSCSSSTNQCSRPEGAYANEPCSNQQGVLINLREDGESKLTGEDKEQILQLVRQQYNIVEIRDAHRLPYAITPDIREQYVNSLFKQYRERELIVTDMMHGMIFAIINHIPCVALDDAIPHKISGYRDIVGNSVQFADTVEDIPYCINKLKDTYEPISLKGYFKEFECFVKSCIS